MPPPFIELTLNEFKTLLDDWHDSSTRRRRIDEVHMHHTWRPNHAQYRGHESIVGMWRTHTQKNGWSDIAQHVTIAPDGKIWTGRHWDNPPASSKGANGTSTVGPFMFEMIGDFDSGRDPFQDPQREAALWVTALVQQRFGLPPESLRFHRQLGSPKSCPGTALDYAAIVESVRALHGQALPAMRTARSIAASYNPLAAARDWITAAPSAMSESPDADHCDALAAQSATPPFGLARQAGTLDAATLNALRPHVVNLWGGRFSTEGQFHTSESDLQRIVEGINQRVEALGKNETLPIVLYAHGGLNSETSGLRIAANQIPWWIANGTYPIQFVWETGFLETIARMMGAQRGVRGFTDSVSDPTIEALVRGFSGGRVWSGMKYGAASAFEPEGAGVSVVRKLADCVARAKGKLRFHAVGHSAGAIFHSYLVPALADAAAVPIDSLCLLAPAITVEDYLTRLDKRVGSSIGRMVVYTMAKDWELADSVGPYRKSLLYLIHRALESRAREPILGLEESLRGTPYLVERFGLGSSPGAASVVWSRTPPGTGGRRASLSTSHGGFDNDVATMESVMREILDLPDAAPLPQGFPPDTEERSAAFVPGAATEPAGGGGGIAALASAGGESTSPAIPGGARRALCVGIDAYPDPGDRLAGCVADAQAWGEAFQALGFRVELMTDGQARRETILARLEGMISESRPGDQLAFQFAGHGTRVPDYDGDEPDGEDEAFCPHDYAAGHLIVDDDFRDVFSKLKAGVTLTCFFDTCHSGTITRVAVGRMFPGGEGRARYVVPSPNLIAAHRQFRLTEKAARHSREAATPNDTATPNEMPQIVFAACKPEQKAMEVNGRGAFSVRAIPLLARAGTISNAQFEEEVLKAFGSSPIQHPNLDCAAANRYAAFLLPSSAGAFAGGAAVPAAARAGDRNAAVANLLQAVVDLLRSPGPP